MNPKETPGVTVEALLSLRQEPDALRRITETLRVKEMGPADHIRTKHEAKAFVASGAVEAAESLLKTAAARHVAQHERERVSQRQGQRMGL
jgi:hypothetical protein